MSKLQLNSKMARGIVRRSFNSLLMALPLFMVLQSCDKETGGTMVFRAEVPASGYQSANGGEKIERVGTKLYWLQGDALSIYDATHANATYQLTQGAGGTTGRFEKISGSDLRASSTYTAVYPTSISTGLNFSVSLPSVQSASANSTFAALPLFARSTTASLKFYNLCGVVRMRLSSNEPITVSSIKVTTNQNICGTANLTANPDEAPTISALMGDKTVELDVATPQSISTATDFYIYLPAGTYTTFNVDVETSDGYHCNKIGKQQITITRGKISTITLSGLKFVPQGATNGRYSVSATDSVFFSQGDLQYQASTGTWRFAEHQYDVIGRGNTNISSTYSGWIDLFGWGTSGWDCGNLYYQPYSSTPYVGDSYGPLNRNNLTGSCANADWGIYNSISNGGNAPGLWRTLTHNEWEYLFNSRAASTINGVANARYALAMVNNEAGVIIFADSYSHPSGVALPTGINDAAGLFENNVYSLYDWTAIEACGAVFLPVDGFRQGTQMFDVTGDGGYWSSTCSSDYSAYMVDFTEGRFGAGVGSPKSTGHNVRLVRN